MEDYKARKFDKLLGEKIDGLSDKQLTAHFGLYEGYVKKMNEITQKLAEADPTKSNYSFGEFSELKRREAVAFNGTFLHEMYFDNLIPQGEATQDVKKAITEAFGTWDKFEADIKGAAASTPGWVVLTLNEVDKKVHTYIMYEHHIGLPVKQNLLLALDCWEHAFMIDYGTDKGSYVKAFLRNINWDEVEQRYSEIVKRQG